MKKAEYYWCRIKNNWNIYYWNLECNSWEEACMESDFDEIDKKQIKKE